MYQILRIDWLLPLAVSGRGDVPYHGYTNLASQVNKETTMNVISLHFVTMYSVHISIFPRLLYNYHPHIYIAVYCSILHDAIPSHLYPTPVRYSTCSGSPSASIGSPATADSEICAFPGGPLRGPDKIVIPLHSVFRTFACESGFSCIGASISRQAVAAPPPLGLKSCTTIPPPPPLDCHSDHSQP